uniref:C-type lectin domain-containing protein n=1 Tax=Hucho hucho TaxID=62062 RepID=A0A4W5NEM7_9TELE
MDMTPLLLLLCAGGFCTVGLSRLRQFTLSERKVNSTEALTTCQKNYSDPVTVNNQEEYEQLIQLMTSEKITSAWIGLHRTQPSLVWSNGDPVNYTVWSPPNYTNPNCVATNPNVTWEICYQEKNFMCYKKGVHDPTLRYTLVTEKKTWYDAQSYCRENYTDLVSIMNEGEKEEVKNKGMNSTTPYWIGLLYDDWEWGDGGRSVYRNWFKLKLNSDIYYYPQAGEAVPVLMQNGMLTVPPGNENLYTFCSKGKLS